MLPRDSQFSTTPFVFPLFPLYLSLELPSPFIPFATFRLSNRPRLSRFSATHALPLSPSLHTPPHFSPHAHLKANASSPFETINFVTWKNRWGWDRTSLIAFVPIFLFLSFPFPSYFFLPLSPSYITTNDSRTKSAKRAHGLDIRWNDRGGEERGEARVPVEYKDTQS